MRAGLLAGALAAGLLLTGCTASAPEVDACGAAAALTADAEPEAVTAALEMLVELLPDEVRPAGEALLAGDTEVGGGSALDALREWGVTECRLTIFVGASAGAVDEATIRLADVEVVVGRSGDRVAVTVSGAPGEVAALALCAEALEEQRAAGDDDVRVWVRDPFGVAIVAGSSDEECRVLEGAIPGR